MILQNKNFNMSYILKARGKLFFIITVWDISVYNMHYIFIIKETTTRPARCVPAWLLGSRWFDFWGKWRYTCHTIAISGLTDFSIQKWFVSALITSLASSLASLPLLSCFLGAASDHIWTRGRNSGGHPD